MLSLYYLFLFGNFNYFCPVDALELMNKTTEIGGSIPVNDQFNGVFWALIAFNLIVFALVRTFHPNYFRNLFSTALNNRQLFSKVGDDLALFRPFPLLLNLTYFNCLAIIIWLVSTHFSERFVLVILSIVFGAFIIKLVLMQSIIFFTQSKEGLLAHQFNHLIYYQLATIVLTPALIFSHYLSNTYRIPVLIGLISLVVLFIFIREVQSFIRAIQFRVSIFYIILYLCTLEILPLVVSIRVFTLNGELFN